MIEKQQKEMYQLAKILSLDDFIFTQNLQKNINIYQIYQNKLNVLKNFEDRLLKQFFDNNSNQNNNTIEKK